MLEKLVKMRILGFGGHSNTQNDAISTSSAGMPMQSQLSFIKKSKQLKFLLDPK